MYLSDALVGGNVLHNAIVFDYLPTMEDTLRHSQKEGGPYKDILDPASLQPSNERIRPNTGTHQRVRKHKLPNFGLGDDNRRRIKNNVDNE